MGSVARVLHKLPACLVQKDKLVGLNIFTRSRIVGFDQLELLTSPGSLQAPFLSSPMRLWGELSGPECFKKLVKLDPDLR